MNCGKAVEEWGMVHGFLPECGIVVENGGFSHRLRRFRIRLVHNHLKG
jgi:hypothetical protein